MDVHVDISRVDVEVYKIRYVRTVRYQPFVCLLDSLMEIRMFHKAPIDKEILMSTLPLCRLRLCREAADTTESRFYANGQ